MIEDDIKPTGAYDLLTPAERQVVDEYVQYVIVTQRQRRERIALALSYPIPVEFMRRSRGVLAKPIPRAALAERIKEEAQKQDLSPDTLIQEYYNIAYANMEDYFETGHFGDMMLKDWSTIPREKLAAVKAVRTKPTMNGMQTEIVLHDKRGAMDVLAKLMGMVQTEGAPLLEDYASNDKQAEQRLLDAPADVYAAMLEGE